MLPRSYLPIFVVGIWFRRRPSACNVALALPGAAMIMIMVFAKTRADIDKYAKGKLWYWHLPLWLFGVYVFVELVGFNLIDPQPFVLAVPHSFDFILHEFAHVFTAWLPPLLAAVSGSAVELLLGGLLVYGAYQFRNYFASLFCCLWFMLTCMSVGSYMADAVPQKIPLVSLGGSIAGAQDVVHDWNFIFGELNMLDSSAFIGNSLRMFGIIVGLFGLVFSAWIIYKMAAAASANEPTESEKTLLKNAQVNNNSYLRDADGKGSIYPTATRGNLSHPSPTEGPPGRKKL